MTLLRRTLLTTALASILLLSASYVPRAVAAVKAPGWELTARTYPTDLTPGGKGLVSIGVYNVGATNSEGSVTVTDILPEGLTAVDAGDQGSESAAGEQIGHGLEGSGPLWECTGNSTGPPPSILGATVVTCTNNLAAVPFIPAGGGNPGWTNSDTIGGYASTYQGPIAIAVVAGPKAAGSVTNEVSIAGGGAPNVARTTDPVTYSAVPAGFGFSGFDGWFSNADGTLDVQAGSHPYEATFNIVLNTTGNAGVGASSGGQVTAAGGEIRDVELGLPPGLIGDPSATPQCSRKELDGPGCPDASQVGMVAATLGGITLKTQNVYNMIPPAGTPALLAWTIAGIETFATPVVRSGGDYGITGRTLNAPQRGITDFSLTLWGVPSDPTHDPFRGTNSGLYHSCTGRELRAERPCAGGPESRHTPFALKPFLTLPTQCGGDEQFSIRANTWQHPEAWEADKFTMRDEVGRPTVLRGCEALTFGPSLSLAPSTTFGDTAAGLAVDVRPPTGGLTEPEGRSTSDIRNTTVVLPAGLVVNPGQAAGLTACQPSEGGLSALANGEEDNGPPSCPATSRLGSVAIKTPLLEGAAEKELRGSVYLLRSNPPTLKLLVAASGDGVNVKLVGNVQLDQITGQLTSTFTDTPDIPISELTLTFNGGAKAALGTPTACGVYTTHAIFSPWSSPFVADVMSEASFSIEHGPGGGPCPTSPPPFAPSMTAGSVNDLAAAFTSFSLLLQNGDGQQRIGGLQFRSPAGLSAMLSKVPLCPEPNADVGTCPAASQIGHNVLSVGPGSFPLVLPEPGRPESPIYLTGPYRGAPFGLSIVTHVLAGPFDLGIVVVRATVEIDPRTAQISIATDESGPYAIPKIISGVPVDLRSDYALIDRPEFMFNPTNCSSQDFIGGAISTQGVMAPLSSHFQVGACKSLGFAPDFKVTTSGKTSKANGASLVAKVVYPEFPHGGGQASVQANITRAKFDLPRQLPSRLTTLQKACRAAIFEANPASCPAASIVGRATVSTPVLPVPLSGPAYFVSHGGEAFPSLTVVLQGYGVTIELVGSTFIKSGVTSTTFTTVPDAPFRTFELVLPQGKYSAVTAYGNLCKSKLAMPTAFVAQNGAEIHRTTTVSVTGCPKHKKGRGKKAKSRTGRR